MAKWRPAKYLVWINGNKIIGDYKTIRQLRLDAKRQNLDYSGIYFYRGASPFPR